MSKKFDNAVLFFAATAGLILTGCVTTDKRDCPCEEQAAVAAECPKTSRDAGAESAVVPVDRPQSQTAVSPDLGASSKQVAAEAIVEVSNEANTTGQAQPLPEQSPIEERDIGEATTGEVLYSSTDGLNVRSGPSMEYSTTRQLKRGEAVTKMGREGIWVMIGQNEYVSIKYLRDRPN